MDLVASRGRNSSAVRDFTQLARYFRVAISLSIRRIGTDSVGEGQDLRGGIAPEPRTRT